MQILLETSLGAEVESHVIRRMREAVGKAAAAVAATASKTQRFEDRTFRLRRSIGSTPGAEVFGGVGAAAVAGDSLGVDYAIFIEDGTKHIAPRKFMASALESNEERIESMVADAVIEGCIDAGFFK